MLTDQAVSYKHDWPTIKKTWNLGETPNKLFWLVSLKPAIIQICYNYHTPEVQLAIMSGLRIKDMSSVLIERVYLRMGTHMLAEILEMTVYIGT